MIILTSRLLSTVIGGITLLAVAWNPAVAAPPSVVVTIKPVHSLLAGVMDGTATPTLLFSGTEDPHALSLRPSQARSLGDADIVVRIGPDLEQGLNRALAALATNTMLINLIDIPGLKVFHARKAGAWTDGDHTDEHSDDAHDHGHLDPHIWLSPVNARAIVTHFAKVLGRKDPANASRYQSNAEKVLRRITALDEHLEITLTPVRDIPIMVFHDALQNFERHYHLNILGAVAVGVNRAPGARRVRQLRERIISAGVACLFTEPQFTPKMSQPLIEGTPVTIVEIDPLGATIASGPDQWFEMMMALGERISACKSQ